MLSVDGLHRQSKITGEDLYDFARSHLLKVFETDKPTHMDCIELAKVMAYDLRTMLEHQDRTLAVEATNNLTAAQEWKNENPNGHEEEDDYL